MEQMGGAAAGGTIVMVTHAGADVFTPLLTVKQNVSTVFELVGVVIRNTHQYILDEGGDRCDGNTRLRLDECATKE